MPSWACPSLLKDCRGRAEDLIKRDPSWDFSTVIRLQAREGRVPGANRQRLRCTARLCPSLAVAQRAGPAGSCLSSIFFNSRCPHSSEPICWLGMSHPTAL